MACRRAAFPFPPLPIERSAPDYINTSVRVCFGWYRDICHVPVFPVAVSLYREAHSQQRYLHVLSSM